ncbi:DUF1214 domain-containing protein [Bartonella sp. TP]|uniref:DUF1214 domain-containing protein n=1 Tax=Bartonella sp. TP TaxID=3057550 RepID=UPI0025AF96DF|nr:DUF1214 domain-containing protein [Bartonella sp. TP]MDN5249684.1 DUF1214 domain-containing protein [Alphaproteobacteria bacterium]WJW80173.1 DUF1214 domain-containing protein [Bartonella sp. TP]
MIKYLSTVIWASIIGIAIGIASFYFTLRHLPALEHIKIGNWYSTSPGLSIQQSPYEIAHQTIAHKFSLETNEDIILRAKFDENGKRLDAACVYQINGPFPPSSLFTLYALAQNERTVITNSIATFEAQGKLPIAALLPFELSSNNIIAPYNNDYTIYISSLNNPMSGNWLAAPETGKFSLILSLYNSPYLRARTAEKLKLPPIHMISCNKKL